jgi:N-acetylmuramoyl-L-alanine amidase
VPPGSQTLTFDDKTIPSATYQEGNGAAELIVNGTAPLTASFSNEGKTITISPVAQVPSVSSLPPQTPLGAQNVPQVPPTPPIAPPRYFAVVDASHGGDERGAALTDKLAEKDVTLAFARRLRQELDSRGMPTLVLRDGDVTLTADQRADLANSSHPAIYICFHAASLGSGVRLYTALIPAGNEDIGSFLDFDTAQSGFRPGSQTVMGAISTELQKRQIPVRTLSAGLRPLNNITAPAVAVEVAPRSSVSDLTSLDYQAAVSSAVASAIASVRDRLEARR